MPQKDRHKNRVVPIEFSAVEDFAAVPYPGRYTLVFVTGGALRGRLNGRPLLVAAPGVLCLVEQDALEAQALPQAAQSFRFSPDFLDTIPLSPTQCFKPHLKLQTGLALFEGEGRMPLPRVPAGAWQHLFEWFFILGTEVHAQSSGNWVCRVKKYLIQILGMLEDLNREESPSPVDAVLEYIYMNYREKVTLGDLCACAHLNRVTLNELFRERCGETAMGYLQQHRLRVAADMLTHTGMSLDEIAHATGFGYDTYFIRQFKARQGMTPTQFRDASRTLSGMV